MFAILERREEALSYVLIWKISLSGLCLAKLLEEGRWWSSCRQTSLGPLIGRKESRCERKSGEMNQIILCRATAPKARQDKLLLPDPRPLLHSALKGSLRESLTPSLTHICLQLALVTYRLERNVGARSGLSRCRSRTSSFVASNLFLMTKDIIFQPESRLGPLEAAIIATFWVKVPSEPLDPEEQVTVNPVTPKCSRNRTCECSCQQPRGCKYIHSFQTNLIGLPGPGTIAMGWEQERDFLFSQSFRSQVCEPGIWALGPTLPLTCRMSYGDIASLAPGSS